MLDAAWEAGPAPVVAVNRSFAWMRGHADFWAVSEEPEKILGSLTLGACHELLARRHARIWAPDVWAENWTRAMPEAFVQPYPIRDHSAEPVNGCLPGKVDPGWETINTWHGGTTVHALAQCCKRGAKEIHVIGADMSGRGGWGYQYMEETTPWWRNRWEHERGSFERAVTDAAAHGVEIATFTP